MIREKDQIVAHISPSGLSVKNPQISDIALTEAIMGVTLSSLAFIFSPSRVLRQKVDSNFHISVSSGN